jgi:hypothetical protein
MKYDILALLVFCVVGFGGLGYLFVSLTDGINQPAGTQTARTSPVVESSVPPAGPVVEEDATIVLGSPSITTTEAGDVVTVNFHICAPGGGSIGSGDAAVSFNMQGIDGNDCVVDYTADDNKVSCRIPRSLGPQRFTISDGVPNLATIERYCEVS